MILIRVEVILMCFLQLQNNKIVEADSSSSKVTNGFDIFFRKILNAHEKMYPDTNVVFSPLSIGVLLNLLMMGTDGDSYLEIRKAFNYSSGVHDSEINTAYQNLISSQQIEDLSHTLVQKYSSEKALINLLFKGIDCDTYMEVKKIFNQEAILQDDEESTEYQRVLIALQQIERNTIDSAQQKGKNVHVHLKTKLFIQKGFSLLNTFKSISKTSYIAETEILDFQRSNFEAKKRINSWVSNNTNGYINELIQGDLDYDTKLVAANVIFFNGSWKNPFSYRKTKHGVFCAEKRMIPIQIMTTSMNTAHLIDNEHEIEMISLPYVGDRYSLLILQPLSNCKAAASDLKEIQKKLYEYKLKSLIQKMSFKKVKVSIPRMKLKSDFHFMDYLHSLGVKKIFSPQADFRKLSAETGVYLNDIIHKAYLQITEEGTLAAAGTATVTSKSLPDAYFELNRASLLLIRDDENDLILFYAKVVEPDPLNY